MHMYIFLCFCMVICQLKLSWRIVFTFTHLKDWHWCLWRPGEGKIRFPWKWWWFSSYFQVTRLCAFWFSSIIRKVRVGKSGTKNGHYIMMTIHYQLFIIDICLSFSSSAKLYVTNQYEYTIPNVVVLLTIFLVNYSFNKGVNRSSYYPKILLIPPPQKKSTVIVQSSKSELLVRGLLFLYYFVAYICTKWWLILNITLCVR